MYSTHRSPSAFFVFCGVLFFGIPGTARSQMASSGEALEAQAAEKSHEAEKQQLEADENHWKEYCGGKTTSSSKPVFLTGPATGYYSKGGKAIAQVLDDKKALPG